MEIQTVMQEQSNKGSLLKDLRLYSEFLGSVIFSLFIWVFIGVLLDRWLETSPWFTLIGLVVGLVAGWMIGQKIINKRFGK